MLKHDPLVAALRRLMDEGTLRPGDRLPSESELGAEYDLTRPAVRNAVQELQRLGYVLTRSTAGTFVLDRRVLRRVVGGQRGAGYVPGIPMSAAVAASGMVQTSSITVEIRPADEELAAQLGIPPGEEVLVRTRLMLADGSPVQHSVSHVPRRLSVGTPLEEPTQGPVGMVYSHFIALGYELTAEEVVVGQLADPEMAELLSIPAGAPVFVITRIVRAADGTVLDINESTAPCTRWELEYRGL